MDSSLSTPAPVSSTACAAGAPQTSERWFTEEVIPHGPLLRNYLKGRFPTVRDVEDLVQESYLRLWKAKFSHPISSGKAFLFTVARRLALDVLRKERRAPLDYADDLPISRVPDLNLNAAETLLHREAFERLADAIASLPERTREIIILHKLRGRSQKEVSDQLGIPQRTVEKHCLRALKHCATYLEKHDITGFFDLS